MIWGCAEAQEVVVAHLDHRVDVLLLGGACPIDQSQDGIAGKTRFLFRKWKQRAKREFWLDLVEQVCYVSLSNLETLLSSHHVANKSCFKIAVSVRVIRFGERSRNEFSFLCDDLVVSRSHMAGFVATNTVVCKLSQVVVGLEMSVSRCQIKVLHRSRDITLVEEERTQADLCDSQVIVCRGTE